MTQSERIIVFTLTILSLWGKLKKGFSFDTDCPATHVEIDFLEYQSGGGDTISTSTIRHFKRWV